MCGPAEAELWQQQLSPPRAVAQRSGGGRGSSVEASSDPTCSRVLGILRAVFPISAPREQHLAPSRLRAGAGHSCASLCLPPVAQKQLIYNTAFCNLLPFCFPWEWSETTFTFHPPPISVSAPQGKRLSLVHLHRTFSFV